MLVDIVTSFGTDTSEFGDLVLSLVVLILLACNFDAAAEVDNGSCTFAQEGYDCDGLCLEDLMLMAFVTNDEIAGCTMKQH